MRYERICAGEFLARPNRFEADVKINGECVRVHVCNTGRCRELLVAGAKVYLADRQSAARKTRYDLVCVEKRGEDGSVRLINMDSAAPNRAVEQWLIEQGASLRREVMCGDSRFDFCLDGEKGRTWIEVKGVTLERDGIALFPDAPTERGRKHLLSLIERKRAGEGARVILVIQMEGIRAFAPNDETDPAFADALRAAWKAGVRIEAYGCRVTPDSMQIQDPIPVYPFGIPEEIKKAAST